MRILIVAETGASSVVTVTAAMAVCSGAEEDREAEILEVYLSLSTGAVSNLRAFRTCPFASPCDEDTGLLLRSRAVLFDVL
jgi:hypothetical protein